ncbi:TPA: hypothetical protein N0F65_002032 [Lagenidium giganteum]|uniref:adenine phosphoribosyltransferase n=1 Tax=Lagenidium giganteum TaxID=4803 RepID=A0AAV2Z3Q3_9STRA|nr:TPA: hypothetical protein N0F65_002032 [Lagenidium giganteum]
MNARSMTMTAETTTTPVDVTNEEAVTAYLREKIRVFNNFPKPGVHFSDVTTLLLDPVAFQVSIDALKHRYASQNITHVVSCESRGFFFGPPLALALKLPFVPIRRARRLPGSTVGVDYTSGFYTGRLEMHDDAVPKGARVVVIDDLVATGNTLKVTCSLIQQVGAEVVECGCVINSIRSSDTPIPVHGLLRMKHHPKPCGRHASSNMSLLIQRSAKLAHSGLAVRAAINTASDVGAVRSFAAKASKKKAGKGKGKKGAEDANFELMLRTVRGKYPEVEPLDEATQERYNEIGRRYNKMSMIKHNHYMRDLQNKIDLKWAAINALPAELQAEALEEDIAAVPESRMFATWTPPIEGFRRYTDEGEEEA